MCRKDSPTIFVNRFQSLNTSYPGPSIDETRKKQCKIVVGANAAGKCIGKGGENVKRLKSEFSVWIKVMGRDDSIPGLDERTITVSGDSDNTIKAIQDVSSHSNSLSNLLIL